jgi:hypothetical protein
MERSALWCYLIRSASGGGTRVGPFMAATLDAARALLACALDKQSKLRAVPVSLGDAYVETGWSAPTALP